MPVPEARSSGLANWAVIAFASLASIAIHGAAIVFWTGQPSIEPRRAPALASAALSVSRLDVQRQQLNEIRPSGDAVGASQATGATAGVGRIRSDRARVVAPEADSLRAAAPAEAAFEQIVRPADGPIERVGAAGPVGGTVTATRPRSLTAPARAPVPTPTLNARPAETATVPAARSVPTAAAEPVAARGEALRTTPGEATTVSARKPPGYAMPPAPPATVAVSGRDALGARLGPSQASAVEVPGTRPAPVAANAPTVEAASLDGKVPSATVLSVSVPGPRAIAARSFAGDEPTLSAAAPDLGMLSAAETPLGVALGSQEPAPSGDGLAVAAIAPARVAASEPVEPASTLSSAAVPVAATAPVQTAQPDFDLALVSPPVGPASPSVVGFAPVLASSGRPKPDTVAMTFATETEAAGVLTDEELAAIETESRAIQDRRTAAFFGGSGDIISETLLGFPCSRLQAQFAPEDNILGVRGHVPSRAVAFLIEPSLQAATGGSFAVSSSVQILPEPQCGVLARYASLGVPQSRDQLDDPLTVGEAAQASVLDFVKGEVIVLGIETPDFPAYLYVDLYSADGSVLHVFPYRDAGREPFPAETQIRIGDGSGGGPVLVAAPPIGLDVVTVLSVSRPLPAPDRPVSEPAGSYTSWLSGVLERVRAEDSAFQAEWVYSLIETVASR